LVALNSLIRELRKDGCIYLHNQKELCLGGTITHAYFSKLWQPINKISPHISTITQWAIFPLHSSDVCFSHLSTGLVKTIILDLRTFWKQSLPHGVCFLLQIGSRDRGREGERKNKRQGREREYSSHKSKQIFKNGRKNYFVLSVVPKFGKFS
jgi:hypothetical protein